MGGTIKHPRFGGNNYVVSFVYGYIRFKVVKCVPKKSDTMVPLLSLIEDCITPQKLSIKCIRKDDGGEFEGEFQRELDRRSITHSMPHQIRHGTTEWLAITLMEELYDVIHVPRETLWTRRCFSRVT